MKDKKSKDGNEHPEVPDADRLLKAKKNRERKARWARKLSKEHGIERDEKPGDS